MAGYWLKVLLSLVLVGLTRGQNDLDFCYYGNTPIQKPLYLHLIGWSCFEHVGYNAVDSEMYACVSDDGFKVPCLRNGNRYLDFSSKLSRKYLLEVSAEEEEFTKCIQKNGPCRVNPTSDSMTRVWVPASVCDTEPRNKFHIAMLSISFIIGIPAFMFLIYFSWTDPKDITLLLHRNLICAVTFRSLMTLLIQTEVILPQSEGSNQINLEGIPALATFETLTLDLVLGFWMVQTMALWKIITNEHGIPLRVNIYTYASIGLSLSFTLIWVIVMASTQDLENWIGVRSWPQWLNEPLRIIFVLFQVSLICLSSKKIFWDAKNPLEKHDPKSSRRIRIETIYVLILTPIFILQFCLNAGSPNGTQCEEAFFYVYFFIDGIQGALVCLFFFYINSDVKKKFETLFRLDVKETEPVRPIRTLDSLRDRSGESNDVVYSSVLDPERHARTLQLYQKRSLMPLPSVTMVEGEEFVTCAERKISTATVFFDAVSFEEEPENLPDPVALRHLAYAKEQAGRDLEPHTPILDSKYSTVGQSLSSSSSISSMEAVRSSMPEDLEVTPRILLTQPTVEEVQLEGRVRDGGIVDFEDGITKKKDSDTTEEFRTRLKKELDDVLDNLQSTARVPYVYNYQDEDSINSFELEGIETKGDQESERMREYLDVMDVSSDETVENVKHEEVPGSRVVLRQSSGTSHGILDETNVVPESLTSSEGREFAGELVNNESQKSEDPNSEDAKEFTELSRSSSTSSVYSEDERVPDTILDLLLHKNVDKLPSEHSEDREFAGGQANHESQKPEDTNSENSKEFTELGRSSSTSSVYSEDERVPDAILDLLLHKNVDKHPSEHSEDREFTSGQANHKSQKSEDTNSENAKEFTELDRSSSTSSVYSGDERVPDTILNLLLHKNVDQLPSEHPEHQDFNKSTSSATELPANDELKTIEDITSEHSIANLQNKAEIQNTPLTSNNTGHETESSSSDEHSENEPPLGSSKTEPVFEKLRFPKPHTSSESSSEYSSVLKTEKPTVPENRQPHTLPRRMEPIPKPRPLNLSDERRSKFSTMFSKHRDKVLSRSEDTKPTLRKFPGFDNLSSTEALDPTVKPTDDDWLPQNVHFADN